MYKRQAGEDGARNFFDKAWAAQRKGLAVRDLKLMDIPVIMLMPQQYDGYIAY